MKKKMKTSCPICGSKDVASYWTMPEYRLSKCKSCSMVWDHNCPKNPLAQYNRSYFINEDPKGGYANYFEGMRVNKRTFSERLKRIEERYGKGKLLDVGCALGDCLVEAKRLGWKEPEGLEVADYAYDFAKKRGLNVKKGVLKKDTYEEERFDVVCYQDVIEHVKDPIEELKKARRVLKKGGIIFLVTPDVGGWWRKLLGRWWYHYKPGEHIMYFSEESIKKALETAGYKNIETRKTYHVLSIEYVLNRLRYYSPAIFGSLLSLVKGTPVKDWPFRAYTGEIEAWGEK